MKKLIISIMVTILLISAVTYAYTITQTKTNEHLIKIGNLDVGDATLTALQSSDAILVPINASNLTTNEVKQLQFELYVESSEEKNFRLDNILPEEFRLTTNNTNPYMTTNTKYIITVELLVQVSYTSQTFYLWVNFI